MLPPIEAAIDCQKSEIQMKNNERRNRERHRRAVAKAWKIMMTSKISYEEGESARNYEEENEG